MSPEDIAAKVKDAPESVKNCATEDKVFYTKGACDLGSTYTCPFQNKKLMINLEGNKLPVCTRYHPQYLKK